MKTRKIPMRRCVGCMESKPKRELIRIVYTTEGKLIIDSTGKINGRGVYLCPNADCIVKAKKKNAVAHGLEKEIDGQQLNDIFEELLTYGGNES